jgi:hypothetical protein
MASLALTLKGVRADKRRRLVSEGVPKIKFGSVCHIQRLGHLRQTDIPSRCAGADEVQHLARCHTEVSGTFAGMSAEALFVVTTAVLSMVAQSASVLAI